MMNLFSVVCNSVRIVSPVLHDVVSPSSSLSDLFSFCIRCALGLSGFLFSSTVPCIFSFSEHFKCLSLCLFAHAVANVEKKYIFSEYA